MEKFRDAGDDVQGELSAVDTRRVPLVWAPAQFYRGAVFAHGKDWVLDEVASGDAGGREPSHSANVPGVLSGQLHEPFRTRADRETGFSVAVAHQHAICGIAAASGFRRVRECGFGC